MSDQDVIRPQVDRFGVAYCHLDCPQKGAHACKVVGFFVSTGDVCIPWARAVAKLAWPKEYDTFPIKDAGGGGGAEQK